MAETMASSSVRFGPRTNPRFIFFYFSCLGVSRCRGFAYVCCSCVRYRRTGGFRYGCGRVRSWLTSESSMSKMARNCPGRKVLSYSLSLSFGLLQAIVLCCVIWRGKALPILHRVISFWCLLLCNMCPFFISKMHCGYCCWSGSWTTMEAYREGGTMGAWSC